VSDAGLSADQIVDAAMRLTRRDGLDGLSMRKLAAELGVTSMAPYAYFSSKDRLVEAITDQVFAQVKLPDDVGAPWDEQLRQLAWAVHDTLVEYPGVADQIYTYQRFPVSAVPLLDYGVRVLRDAGFDDHGAAEAFDVLASVVITRTHFEAHQRQVMRSDPAANIEARIKAGWERLGSRLDEEVPSARSYVDHLDRASGATIFERAVDVVLRGLATELAQS
jgi:AcrR family transcriptional regulator